MKFLRELIWGEVIFRDSARLTLSAGKLMFAISDYWTEHGGISFRYPEKTAKWRPRGRRLFSQATFRGSTTGFAKNYLVRILFNFTINCDGRKNVLCSSSSHFPNFVYSLHDYPAVHPKAAHNNISNAFSSTARVCYMFLVLAGSQKEAANGSQNGTTLNFIVVLLFAGHFSILQF